MPIQETKFICLFSALRNEYASIQAILCKPIFYRFTQLQRTRSMQFNRSTLRSQVGEISSLDIHSMYPRLAYLINLSPPKQTRLIVRPKHPEPGRVDCIRNSTPTECIVVNAQSCIPTEIGSFCVRPNRKTGFYA